MLSNLTTFKTDSKSSPFAVNNFFWIQSSLIFVANFCRRAFQTKFRKKLKYQKNFQMPNSSIQLLLEIASVLLEKWTQATILTRCEFNYFFKYQKFRNHLAIFKVSSVFSAIWYYLRFLWCVSSCSESFRLLVWRAENTTSGQGTFRERTPVGSRFSELLFLDVPGTATEQVRTCGFRRNSSSLDKEPKMRDSVRLHSWESFSVTLPSISSESWVMYSSAIPGLSVFCDWLFLLFSAVSLETAANFLLVLNVVMIWGKTSVSCNDWNDFYFITKRQSPLLWGRMFQ